MNDTPDRDSAPTLYVSEDDLETVLDGRTVKLPYPGVPDGVLWELDAACPLEKAAVEALRTSGLHYRVREPSGDEPFMPLLRLGAPPWPRDEEGVHVVLSPEAYRLLCGDVQSSHRLDTETVRGNAWEELRRSFPAADYVPEPTTRLHLDAIAADDLEHAQHLARSVAAAALECAKDPDVVYLAPVSEGDGRYAATVLFHDRGANPTTETHPDRERRNHPHEQRHTHQHDPASAP